ncbi:MAG: hypothetical protein NZ700_17320 [Gemmataceae bacterium]|nr:hypothetical protein [Gemmataceae bacterium]MDW8263834.1 hypothetical protein [Gemmataceae bacterium]
MRPPLAALLVGLSATAADAQTPQFCWKPGQVLTYRVEQTTTAVETVNGTTTQTATKLNHVKRWQVLAVDNHGVATLQLTLQSLRLAATTPSGETIAFDSTAPDKSHPQMREQLSKYVGPVLATLKVDPRGRVMEVVESKHGPASRYESEPPFVLILPAGSIQAGQSWHRDYAITLEPPHGTGEKYQAQQQYVCKALADGTATITIAGTLKTQPEAVADRIPLLQMQPEGEVVFDLQAGCLRRARMQIDKTLSGHQGEGSSYRFSSTYVEELVTAP